MVLLLKNETEEIKKGIYQFLSMSELREKRKKWEKQVRNTSNHSLTSFYQKNTFND